MWVGFSFDIYAFYSRATVSLDLFIFIIIILDCNTIRFYGTRVIIPLVCIIIIIFFFLCVKINLDLLD